MADAATPELRRKVARLSAHEAAAASPSLLIEVKRLVAEIDALPREDQLTHAATLSADGYDWGRLFRGCVADRNRGRFSIYRRSRAHLTALQAALEAILA